VSTGAAAGALCFARDRRGAHATLAEPPQPASMRSLSALDTLDTLGLPADVALALADALPFLRCGEESAVHAFGRRLARHHAGGEGQALAAIAADEVRHAAWLEALAAQLPAPPAVPDAEAMSAFFRGLLTRDPALHFARIAALDLAVCALLQPLVASGTCMVAAPRVHAGLRAIRSDEARHVRVARRCARALGWQPEAQRRLDLALREQLAALLEPVQASLARLGFRGFAIGASGTRAHDH
jgi:rubrerythrin